jgi:hypothetical protein
MRLEGKSMGDTLNYCSKLELIVTLIFISSAKLEVQFYLLLIIITPLTLTAEK